MVVGIIHNKSDYERLLMQSAVIFGRILPFSTPVIVSWSVNASGSEEVRQVSSISPG